MDDTNYADWTWETVLGNVLNIAVPDRGAVTGQPWLVIRRGGDTLPGAHEFWNASWTATSTKAAGAISVYLNPALSDPAGPASLFQGAPDVLSGVPDGAYGTLPLQPPAFKAVGVTLTNVTDWFGTAAQQFNVMGQSLPDANSGEAAQMFADLFGRLQTVATSLHDQMSVPVSYASAIGDTAGDAAVSFLTGLWSAYSAWTQQPASTPTGAIVQVLQGVGQLQPDGTYVIGDPENTTFGDLTTDQAWAAVEQQAKNQWLGLLTTGTGGFAGLDPLAHAALSTLISQYDSAISVLQPVTGAAPPAGPGPADPPPVGGGPNTPVNLGAFPGAPPPVPPPPGPVTAGGPVNLISLAGGPAGTAPGPVPDPPPPGGGPASQPLVFAPARNVQNASVVQGPPAAPAAGAPGASPPAGFTIGALGTVGPAAAFTAGPALTTAAVQLPGANPPDPAATPPAAVPAATLAVAGPAVLTTGVIGAVDNNAPGALGDQAPAQTQRQTPAGAALTGGVLLPIALGKTSDPPDQQTQPGNAATDPNQAAATARVAPAAGATLGRGANGTVLTQAQVPALAAKPPSIQSSAINTQLAAAVTGPNPVPPAGTLPVGSVDALAAAGSLPGGAPGGLPGGLPGGVPGMPPGGVPGAHPNGTGPDLMTTFMIDQNGEPYVGVNGPMMMPQATMGMGGGIGGGFGGGIGGHSAGQSRVSYLPEDEESWGTDAAEPEADMDAPLRMRQYRPDPEEEDEETEIPSGFGAIGRRRQPS